MPYPQSIIHKQTHIHTPHNPFKGDILIYIYTYIHLGTLSYALNRRPKIFFCL